MEEFTLSYTAQLLDTAPKLVLLGLLFCLLGYLVKGKKAFVSSKSVARSSVFNLCILIVNIAILTPIVVFLASYLRTYAVVDASVQFWQSVPLVIVVIACVFMGDFIAYWRHRFEHSRYLWPSHSVHHSDEHMTWLTLERFHPINRLTTYIIDASFLLLLGFPPYAIIANGLIRHYYGYFIHADLPWMYGKFSLVFVSPVMHRWHHANDPEAYNTNFATVFSVFDRAFGTYRVPGQCTVALGVNGVSQTSLLKQLIHPFKLSSYKSHAAKKEPEGELNQLNTSQ